MSASYFLNFFFDRLFFFLQGVESVRPREQHFQVQVHRRTRSMPRCCDLTELLMLIMWASMLIMISNCSQFQVINYVKKYCLSLIFYIGTKIYDLATTWNLKTSFMHYICGVKFICRCMSQL
jgi:hypothetical protein